MSDPQRIDAENELLPIEGYTLYRALEHHLAEAEAKIKHLESKFTKLDKPMYSGNPMLDSVLETSNPEFDAWVKSQSPTYWARYDLSAARIGWEAAMTR